jgi:hypothetical protein
MVLVEDHDVFEALAANRADDALDVRAFCQCHKDFNDPLASTRLQSSEPYDQRHKRHRFRVSPRALHAVRPNLAAHL